MIVARSSRNDPGRHLAIEECLMHQAGESGRHFLLFYVNEPCVLFGRHQNPWMEFNVARLERMGIPLLRRLSGGGAVYHDRGNLNFSLILPRTDYALERQMEAVTRALRSLGLPVEPHLRTGLAVAGRKVSGQAFAIRGGAVLHHGTLLIRSDLDRLRDALDPVSSPAVTHAVRSIPSPVMNLCECRPDLASEALQEALVSALGTLWGQDTEERWDDRALDALPWPPVAARFRAREWVFGQTPDFVWPVECAGVRAEVRVVEGRIREIRSDRPVNIPAGEGDWFDPSRLQ